MADDLSQFSLRDLFRIEAEGQTQDLMQGLLQLEKEPSRQDLLEGCMRAAHSLKGAARIVELGVAVTMAHAMEDIFVQAQNGALVLDRVRIDLLLKGVDLLVAMAKSPDLESGSQDAAWQAEAESLSAALLRPQMEPDDPTFLPAPAPPAGAVPAAPQRAATTIEPPAPPEADNRALRVSAENLNRLLDLAGESLVEAGRLKPFRQSLSRLKRMQREGAKALEILQAALPADLLDERARQALADAQRCLTDCRKHLAERLDELDESDRKAAMLAHRLYDQALMVRMRPFADGVGAFPRMVRDIARQLGKQVRLDIIGERTQVDRDILERLEAPLGHLLRNALDHGLETAEERIAIGKPAEGTIRLEARHQAGVLQIVVADDGRGIDIERVRAAVVRRGLASEETAARLGESELLEFPFLPGFTLKEEVTEISGRGVGLDVVQDMVRQVRGRVRITSRPGEGTQFRLELPLTLSVVRSLLVEIGGEPYAFPFAHIVRALQLPPDRIRTLEGRQHFALDEQHIGLVGAHQVLGCAGPDQPDGQLAVIVLGAAPDLYGLVVDRFLGGRELIVQPIDSRLGKIKDIAAASLMEDGTPVLIVDVEDVIRSMEKLSTTDRLSAVGCEAVGSGGERRKRVLVVDDSLTVRELQRKLLEQNGYAVEVAVDGMDGWNALRAGRFDLVVSDIDMPRMDGIELVHHIRQDPAFGALPVMILSYKDREEDRQRGLAAGADYYLTKGSFQSNALIDAVIDLIGEAVE